MTVSSKTFDDLFAATRLDCLAERVTELWAARMTNDAEAIVLGRFELDYVLGRGSYGVVFAAYDRELERDVALKLVAGEEQGLREARVLARVQHPNVVTLHDVGRANGFYYEVLARIDGWTMGERVRMGLDWALIIELFVQVGRGLAAVHRANIVHGDVKPGNMLVGRDGRAYLADFGFAQTLVPGETTIIRAGTREYAAPECRDGAAVGPRSDQFSFCVGLWEALYGERPGRFDAAPAKARACGQVPRQLEPVLRRGLSTRPEDRYPDMAALIDAVIVAAQPSPELSNTDRSQEHI